MLPRGFTPLVECVWSNPLCLFFIIGFLFFCIENAYTVVELDTAKQRFEELQPEDPFGDLM